MECCTQSEYLVNSTINKLVLTVIEHGYSINQDAYPRATVSDIANEHHFEIFTKSSVVYWS